MNSHGFELDYWMNTELKFFQKRSIESSQRVNTDEVKIIYMNV